MKKSKYNFIVSEENKIYCFNGTTFNFFSLEKSSLTQLKKIFENPDLYQEILPSFYNLLLKGRFIIENTIDEINYIREINNKNIEEKHYALTILPTLECNFSCWYCVQRHEKGKMTPEILTNLCNHIKIMVTEKKIQSLSLEWFGGEPLLYFHEILYPLALFAQKICVENNIPFYNSATTNGYLIDDEIIERMKLINLNSFQITLDGSKEFHDKVRYSSTQDSSFDKILLNVKNICSKIEDVNVILRFNYDDKNFNPYILIEQIKKIIPEELRSKISFRVRKVWQAEHSEQYRDKILRFKEMSNLAGFNMEPTDDLNMNFIRCYACRKYYNAIAPNGGIYKCTARENFTEIPFGNLQSDGQIKWTNDNFTEKYFKQPLFENEKCLVCKYLPLCMGPCPKSFEENNLNPTIFNCHKSRPIDLKYEDTILQFCKKNQ